MAEENNASSWFQDNLRIIISVGIVILLVFAIYSYSKRDSRTDIVVDDSQIEEVAMTAGESDDEINEIIDEIKDDQENVETVAGEEIVVTEDVDTISNEEIVAKEEAQAALEKKAEAARLARETAAEEKRIAKEEKAKEEQLAQEIAEQEAQKEEAQQKAGDIVREVIESRSTQQVQQKDGVVVVVAIHGDSMTTLARKATSEYINANNVKGLTASHKIYIEDYLRKNQNAQHIHPGTETEHTHAEIAEAIEQSRKLTDAQLNNLAKYAQNVSGL